eukprot:scaffold4862_cov144-Skeletonema_dohrnii-CCMP3373.AAC.1
MIRALTAAAMALAHITLFSASSASAYYYNDYSSYCNKPQCCWALNVNHWDIRNICYGCEGQDVCNQYTPRTPRPTPRPTKKPTNVAWRNDGWNNNSYGDRWSGVQKNYCCQTTGNCPIDTPVVTSRQWLDRAQGVRLTYCCQKSISSWQGDSWKSVTSSWKNDGWRGGGRSLQTLLPLCVNTDMPTSSPTYSPTLSPSISMSPSSTPFASPSRTPSKTPSSSPSSQPSSLPSLQPS